MTMHHQIYQNNLKTYIKIINQYLTSKKLGKEIIIKDSLQKFEFKKPSKIQKKSYLYILTLNDQPY